jgi:endonuclease/exonuclease/phosphatase family metal-dependent hydrolase
VRVATFNLHAGVDGWGRPTRVLDFAGSIGADVLVCPETWCGDDGTNYFEELCQRLGMKGAFAPLARGERLTTGVGGRTWQPRLAHFTGERGLYFSEHRSLTAAQIARREAHGTLEGGEWGLSLFTRFPIEEIRVEPLGRLPRERVRRALIVARLNDQGRRFYVLAVHGAHISHGSFIQYRRINRIAANLDPKLPIIIAGDFNCWRPLLRVLLPGWKTLVRARTWPSRYPHSQIDHVLGRGPWERLGGIARDGGSDHRALIADIKLV